LKVLVLGDSGVGRSTVSQRIAGVSRPSGVSSSISPVKIYKADFDQRVSVQVWDFGSEIMATPTHQFFLFSESMFVVVFNLSDPHSVRRVDYWIDLLQGKLSHAHVVIVGTHADQCACAADSLDTLRSR
jgi:GTPase SAR1 family protein